MSDGPSYRLIETTFYRFSARRFSAHTTYTRKWLLLFQIITERSPRNIARSMTCGQVGSLENWNSDLTKGSKCSQVAKSAGALPISSTFGSANGIEAPRMFAYSAASASSMRGAAIVELTVAVSSDLGFSSNCRSVSNRSSSRTRQYRATSEPLSVNLAN